MGLLKKYKYHFLIIIVGLICLQTLNVLLQLDKQTIIYPDSYNYLESAQNLYFKFSCHNYRPLGMAFIVGLPYLFTSSDASVFQWSLIVNVVCWIGTSIMLFEILKNFFQEKAAFGFAIVPFFFVGALAVNFHLLTESIFIFFMASVFYFIFKFYKTNSYLYVSIGLAILFSSILIKPGIKFLAILAGLFFIKIILKNSKSKATIFLFVSLLLIVIQMISMKVKYGDYTVSYVDSVVLHICLCSKAECYKTGKAYDQSNNPRADYLFSLPYTEQKKVAAADFKNQIKTNSANLFKAYLTGLTDNFKTGSTCLYDLKNTENNNSFPFWKQCMFTVSKWQSRILTLFGVILAIVFLLRNIKRPNALTLVSLYVLYMVAVAGISGCQGDRYHLVIFPFVILLLAVFVSKSKNIRPFFEPPQK